MSLSKILTEDFLTCSICLGKFKDPKILGCTHSFCQHCLQDYFDRNFKGQPGFLCPICRRQCVLPGGGVSGLQTNHLLVSISHTLDQVEQAKASKKCAICCLKNIRNPPTATKRCLDCDESMCGDCSSEHVLHKFCRDHKLFPVDQFDSDEYVTELRARQNVLCDHNNKDPVEIFCPVCKKFVCVGCMVLEHQSHNCLRINIAADKRREKLELHLKHTEKNSLLNDQFKAAAEDQKASVEEGRKKAKTQVEKQLELVITTARQRADTLLEEIDAKSNAKLDILNDLTATVTANQKRLDDFVDFLRKLINHGNDMDILQMTSAFEQCNSDSVQTLDLPAVMTKLQLITNDMEECVTNVNSCLGDVVSAASGRLVTSFKVELTTSPEEMISRVATDTNGDIIISISCKNNEARNRIHIYDNNFVLQGTIPNPRATKKERFGGIAVDDDGNIVTRCEESNEIIVFTKTGDQVRTFHSESPHAVAVNSKGHFVVACHDTLTVYHKDGKVLQTTPDPEGRYSKYIYCNVNDDIIVSDQNDDIRVYDSNLQLKFRYGTLGDGDGQVEAPCGTCCLDNGDIILADLNNHRLHLVSSDGKFKQFLLTKENGIYEPKDVVINRLGQLVVGEISGEIKVFQL